MALKNKRNRAPYQQCVQPINNQSRFMIPSEEYKKIMKSVIFTLWFFTLSTPLEKIILDCPFVNHIYGTYI